MSWTYSNGRKGSTKMDEFGLIPEGCQSWCRRKTQKEVKNLPVLLDGSTVYLK
jgi:hypothetical protein